MIWLRDEGLVAEMLLVGGSGLIAAGETGTVGGLERQHRGTFGRLVEGHARSGAEAAAVAGTIVHPVGAAEMAHGGAGPTGVLGLECFDGLHVGISGRDRSRR